MSEPSVVYCTQRDGWDSNDLAEPAPYIDLEVRFSDGQKFAAVRIDANFPELANRIEKLLNTQTGGNDAAVR